MHHAEVKIICDSVSLENIRLTTFQLRYWRPIHSELMTHRVFSRNAGSSRARPSAAIIEQVRKDPWGPLYWGMNKPGMQAGDELDEVMLNIAKNYWQNAACAAALHAEKLCELNIHKQIANRLLEPFTYIDVLVTSTQFANWFMLRNHPDAQPEIQDLAKRMQEEYNKSTPTLLKPGEWHLPYIETQDYYDVRNYLVKQDVVRSEPNEEQILVVLKKISTARCARISYKPFDGTAGSIEKDIELHDKLVVSQPVHASPAEHQATPDETTFFIKQTFETQTSEEEATVEDGPCFKHPELHGNLGGWIQYRKTLPNEFLPG